MANILSITKEPETIHAESDTTSTVAASHRRLDPRISFVILVLLNVTAFAPTEIWTEVVAVGLCAAVMYWCGRGRATVKWLAVYVVLFLAGLLCVSFPNPVTTSFGTMLILFRRVFCVGMFASNMIATTRVGEMAAALQRVRLPRSAVVSVCVALRFFPTMGREFKAVTEAMRVRGIALAPATVIRHPVTVMENLLVPVMTRLAIVADELANAAVVRGIDSDKPRSSYYVLRIGPIEILFLIAFGALAATVLLMKTGVTI